MKQPVTIHSHVGAESAGPKQAAPESPLSAGLRAKIFVKGVSWVGDAVMSTAALHHIKASHPEAHVTLMVRPWVAPIFEHSPDIDRLWVIDDSEGWGAFNRAATMIRRERFNIGVALPNSTRSALLLKFGGVKHAYGYRLNFPRKLMLNHGIDLDEKLLSIHQVYYYLGLVEPFCGKPKGAPRQWLYPGEIETQEVERLFLELGLDRGQPLIGLAPGSINSNAKRWPAEYFAQLADRISAEAGAAVLLLGSAKEQDVLDRVAAQCRGQVLNLCGRANLGQAIALIRHLMALITNDSGSMHIAAALQVPTVAIFGPTEWDTTYPFSPLAKIVRKEGVECSPCMLRECIVPGHPCMTGVTVDMVMKTFDDLIQQSAK